MKIKNLVSGILIVGGVLAIMGSANDCDGKCMDQVNDISTMLAIVFGGFISIGLGFLISRDSFIKNS